MKIVKIAAITRQGLSRTNMRLCSFGGICGLDKPERDIYKLASICLLRGTSNRTFEEISELVENNAISFYGVFSDYCTAVCAESLPGDLPISAGLISDAALNFKIDSKIFESERRAAISRELDGRDDPLTFHPAFPDTGVRLDPMHSFTNATEIASRIRQAFPPNMDESFANFAWMAVNAIAQGLIALEIRPTLPLIAKYVKLGIYDILEPLLEKHTREYAPKDWQKHYLDLKEKAGKPPAPNVTERLMVLVALYETELHHITPDPAIDGLIEVFRHNREHYSKITASLLPILSMLTTGKLADSLSPTIVDMHDTRPVMNLEKIINGGHVLYIGLDSMPNPTVASTLAGIWLADLANIAGRRYNLGLSALNSRRISLFVDEVSNVINVPLIEILNKGAESGIATTCAMQTIADLAHRMGSLEAAHVVLGNLNNLIALRTKDQMTQNFVVETLGNTYIANQSLSINNRAPDHLSPDYHSGLTRQMNSELEPIFPPDFLGKLPNCEAIVQVSAGYIYKTRCPILVGER